MVESILGHLVPNGGHTVPILSWKLNLDETSFVESLCQALGLGLVNPNSNPNPGPNLMYGISGHP